MVINVVLRTTAPYKYNECIQLRPFVKCPKSLRLLHKRAYMHGYLPCPDVYVKCLCDSTEFFLERVTKRNKIISVQRPEGRLSPFARLLLPTVARWQQIPSLSLHMSLPWPLSGLQASAIGVFSLQQLHRLCKSVPARSGRPALSAPAPAPRQR